MRKRDARDFMPVIVAKRLVEQTEQAGFVVMKKPPSGGAMSRPFMRDERFIWLAHYESAHRRIGRANQVADKLVFDAEAILWRHAHRRHAEEGAVGDPRHEFVGVVLPLAAVESAERT